jgi:indole-3-glycerol phosphate synthase
MPVTLDQIVAATLARVRERKRLADLRALDQQAAAMPPRSFRAALVKRAAEGTAIIAELKKASPSKGIIREHFDVPALAQEYERGGASALSVLTEEEFFLGSLENLRLARAATQLPCLRKDFVVDEFQLLEARANGADAVLLLASVLDDRKLALLNHRARALELDVLCEAHDEAEVQRALAAGCDLVGVNNRDLRTFKVDLDTAVHLAPRLPADVFKVAESGIYTADDIGRLRLAGYKAFLIGEALMRAASPGKALEELITSCDQQAIRASSRLSRR